MLICLYAESKNISTVDVMTNEEHMAKLVQLNIGAQTFAKLLAPFINIFNSIGQDRLGFLINIDSLVLAKVDEVRRENAASTKQTPVIPPRLYGNVINQAWAAITEYEAVENNVLEVMRVMALKSTTGDKQNRKHLRKQRELLKPLLKDNSIANLLKKYGIVNSKENRMRNIQTYLFRLRNICKDLIHAYSGMRDSEALNLPDSCYGKDPNKQRKHARLLGYTFKYTGYKASGSWVTTSEIERVIKILNRQNTVIMESAISKSYINQNDISGPSPLFISPSYLQNYRIKTSLDIKISDGKRSAAGFVNPLYDKEQFRITKEDLVFLQRFEPERDWELEGAYVGELWEFASHQFRRSLAVYSRQSGLVTIGSLQTQLHHLFVETSYYYANNAENCTFDVTDKDHMSKEFANNTASADFAAYIFDIMFSEESLHGVQGRIDERTMRNVEDKEAWITANRKETEKKFSKGEIAHSDTPLGSCNSITPCHEKLTRNIVGCIGCQGASLKLSKIERTISVQEVFIESLSPDSVEYRSEKEDLKQLIELRDKVA
jgi:hypothetical protein